MEPREARRSWIWWLVAWLSLGAPFAWAGEADASVISGTGTAELVQTGDYAGWYKYTYDVTWNLTKGLSHLDLILKPGCTQDDHHIVFETELGGAADGWSTDECWHPGKPVVFTVLYEGMFEPTGDPSINLTSPLIKWEPYENGDEPGKKGTGEFWFYANIIPEYGSLDNVFAAKYGTHKVFGDLVGAYPSCETIPEPASVALVMVGTAMMVVMRRRR